MSLQSVHNFLFSDHANTQTEIKTDSHNLYPSNILSSTEKTSRGYYSFETDSWTTAALSVYAICLVLQS